MYLFLKEIQVFFFKNQDFLEKLTLQETLLASGFQFGCKTKSLIMVFGKRSSCLHGSQWAADSAALPLDVDMAGDVRG